ncbi:MFS transporter [Brevibacillus choshinensis]|uniref:MFS transporter n=1 Tax=Brevibacillus choshinensis TaxID=54911 RepID=UPI002E1D039B|nr:MFS transporter [Brevibacillus choshinensis]
MTTQPVTNSLWRNRSFVRLWCGTILSALADSAFFILLSWFIVDVTGSEAMLGTTLICMSIPRLLFMLVGGVAADRWSRKWIMFSSILARGVILVVFSLLLLDEGGGWLPISAYVIAVLFGTVDAFFWPARSSILPFLVTRDQLAPANSMMEISQQISMVGGPLVSALLIRTAHYPTMFLLLGAAFFVGTLFILSLRLEPVVENNPTSAAVTSSYFKDIFSGIRFTFSVPILSIIFVTSLFTNMTFSGPINMGLPLLVKSLGWDGSAYSSLSITLGIGTIIGGILTGILNGFRGKFMLLPFFTAVMGFAVSSLFFMQHMSLGFAAMFTIGLMLSMTNIPYITYIQSIVPAHMLGRVMSLLSLMSIGLGPVSYAICSFVLEHNVATPAVIMLTGGLGLALISMSLWLFREVRRMEQHPAWARPTEVNPSRSLSS